MYEELKNKLNEAAMILVGLGEKFEYSEECVKDLAEILKEKNYFIVSLAQEVNDTEILKKVLNPEKITFTFGDDVNDTWEIYLKWLQGTLNKDLAVLELATSFKYPDVIRFPFEKTVYYNNKANLIRVNETFYQLPKEIAGKGIGIEGNSKEFLKELNKNT